MSANLRDRVAEVLRARVAVIAAGHNTGATHKRKAAVGGGAEVAVVAWGVEEPFAVAPSEKRTCVDRAGLSIITLERHTLALAVGAAIIGCTGIIIETLHEVWGVYAA